VAVGRHHSQQLVDVEWLRKHRRLGPDVGDGAKDTRMGGHDHDRNRGKLRIGTQSRSKLPTIHAGHHQIEQQERWLVLRFLDECERFPPIFRFSGSVALVFEHRANDLADVFVVVHDQDELGSVRSDPLVVR